MSMCVVHIRTVYRAGERVQEDYMSLCFLLGAMRGPRGEGAVAGYCLAHYKSVDVVGALVGVNTLDIRHVLHHAVVKQDAVASKDVARCSRDAARLGDVVHLEHRDRGRVESSCVLEASDVDGEELAE